MWWVSVPRIMKKRLLFHSDSKFVFIAKIRFGSLGGIVMQTVAKLHTHGFIMNLPPALHVNSIGMTTFPTSKGNFPEKKTKRRTPPPELAATHMADDLIAPAASPQDWNALR